MTMQSDDISVLAARSALEALRNGVPNREAVNILGCNQPRAEDSFTELLTKAADAGNPPESALWMLVSGGFGTGKSHLLAHLEEQALSQDFVCSKVAISKETPLFDLGRVFKSAMESGRMGDRSGRLIEELGQKLNPRSQAYDRFYVWAHDTEQNQLSQMFPATLRIHESNDHELNTDIERFWAGDPIHVARVNEGLRLIRQKQSYSFKAPKAADLPPQRLRFAIELIKAAGYKGWVVLLDEIELVGSYSVLQRGRSYAELTRLMGQAVGEDYPGLIVVGTVTGVFAADIISPVGTKKDHDYMKPKLESSSYRELGPRAETGMRLLEQGGIPLRPPTPDDMNTTVDKLRQIYTKAYGWAAPPSDPKLGGGGLQNTMRYMVRAAINEWDLLRIYPNHSPQIVGEEYRPTYEEHVELERESKDDPGDDPDSGAA